MNQWLPITRSGRAVLAASFEIAICDVLEAKITSGRQAVSSRPSTSAFTASTSTTLSITWSAEAAAVSRSVLRASRPRAAAGLVGGERPAVDQTLEAAVDPREPAVERGVVELDHRHLEARLRDDLRDPASHQAAAAHHDDLLYLHRASSVFEQVFGRVDYL